MRASQLVRCRDGTNRHIVKLDDVAIPDLYKIGEKIKNLMEGKTIEISTLDVAACQEAYSLCHDLLQHCRRMARERQ